MLLHHQGAIPILISRGFYPDVLVILLISSFFPAHLLAFSFFIFGGCFQPCSKAIPEFRSAGFILKTRKRTGTPRQNVLAHDTECVFLFTFSIHQFMTAAWGGELGWIGPFMLDVHVLVCGHDV